ncbi:putative expansin-B2 [Spinacia oleracea]|uniref:Expansin-B2 n=1 Tax=Spinacia oleracea TaxID=3562 RepID=A0A9R0IVG3_SPIOL|nr:putative expansin-B2 [Spinacia oleracea]
MVYISYELEAEAGSSEREEENDLDIGIVSVAAHPWHDLDIVIISANTCPEVLKIAVVIALAILLSFIMVILNLICLVFAILVDTSHCFNTKVVNVSSINSNWSPGGATWYGSPTGAGSNGGACGYSESVERPPFSAMISAGGSSIYESGEGCGVCYEVKCSENKACSGQEVSVTIPDECPGCPSDMPHFDLSGKAFGALAKHGLADQLRNDGVVRIQYKRVKCNYPGVAVAVKVDSGSNPYHFASIIEYADGEGIKSVKLKQQSGEWMSMQRSWGALWALNAGIVLQPPFSLQLTDAKSGDTLTLYNVIPQGWIPGQTYRSHVNFNNYYMI